MIEAQRLTDEQIEERRKNLAFIRENAPSDSDGDHLFITTLLMQEQWLATVDNLAAIEQRVKPFLKRLIEATKPYHRKEGVSNAAETLFDIYEDAVSLRAVLVQGKKE